MGKVYIAVNEKFHEIKIGETTQSIEDRMRGLNTAVPTPYKCVYAVEFDEKFNHRKVESLILDYFNYAGKKPYKSEFIGGDVETEEAVVLLQKYKELLHGKDVTPPEVKKEQKQKKAKREKINIRALGLEKGTKLYFRRDKNITCTVVDDSQVEFEGKTTTLSGSANEILNKNFSIKTAVNGSLWWCYNGKTLSEIRDEVEGK